MAAFVVFSAFLMQRGSGESKQLPDEGENEVDKDPRQEKRPDSPGPVHRGGLALKLYSHSIPEGTVRPSTGRVFSRGEWAAPGPRSASRNTLAAHDGRRGTRSKPDPLRAPPGRDVSRITR
jgi:hypothetical protein